MTKPHLVWLFCCVEVHLHLVENTTNNSTRYQYHNKAASQNFQPYMASHSNTRSKGCNWKVRWWWKRCSIRVTWTARKRRIKIQVVDCWLIVDWILQKKIRLYGSGGLPPIDQMVCKYTEHRSYFLPRKQRASDLCRKHRQTWPEGEFKDPYHKMGSTVYMQCNDYTYIYIYLRMCISMYMCV